MFSDLYKYWLKDTIDHIFFVRKWLHIGFKIHGLVPLFDKKGRSRNSNLVFLLKPFQILSLGW